ncbi:hypothetical protein HED60_19355 [Planctomycetales bacterium ZRK34]|nr:hypothetical protein HED60_19355 [Planctomycetales bacterium ZRK34]
MAVLTFQGDRELLKTLKRIRDYNYLESGLYASVKAGAKPIIASAKALAPRRTGQLRRSIGVKTKAYTRNETVVGVIGPRSGFATVDDNGNRIDPNKYAHLVELGHGGPKPAPPHPFLRPAFEANKNNAIAQARKIMWQKIQSRL